MRCHALKHISSVSSYALRSRVWIPTLKAAPIEAAVPSYQLLLRAGFIRKSGHGTFAMLPLATRVLQKLEDIIDTEMEKINGNKCDLPAIVSSDLWKLSDRWRSRTSELFTFRDRRNNEQILAPTHEEPMTALVAQHHNSTHESLRLYQIGKKYRDEVRPRFGLLRAREFIMKDMYSFDTNYSNAVTTYDAVIGSYKRILQQILRLPVVQVQADTGDIGGNFSHEFHVLASVGEDGILSCSGTPNSTNKECSYAANVEKAQGLLYEPKEKNAGILQSGDLRNSAVKDDTAYHNLWISLARAGQTNNTTDSSQIPYACELFSAGQGYMILVFLRSDRKVNEISIKMQLDDRGNSLRRADLAYWTESSKLRVLIDDSLMLGSSVANNGEPSHSLHEAIQAAQVEPNDGKTLESSLSISIGNYRLAEEEDICPHCKEGLLKASRGIEVAHAFYLGQRYSNSMNALHSRISEGSVVKEPYEMGCFGLGVSRLLAAIVETSHDKNGIQWPGVIAPYHIIVLAIGATCVDHPLAIGANKIAAQLSQMPFVASSTLSGSVHVILDDRWQTSAGVKLVESELIGYPYRVVIGKQYATARLVEVQNRLTMEKTFIKPEELPAYFEDQFAE
uniref:proline--tRNA ligase n=1 Tax=Albugo laibachii Nc14 TaxID=890382 RepID=F0WQ87_9STRA|nr:prolyltRNA synthetase putative [Albugo laibachii Nc14]|eukprot:CCA23493.1 prolyltRNA synthetase putative [Albugo laibachii Nc14]